MTIKKEIIKAYTLKNAVEHNGKARAESIVNSLFSKGLKKNKIKKIMPEVNKILEEVNSLSPEEQKKQLQPLQELIGRRPERVGLQELENVKKGVVMRFAPSASGPMHIGHALTASLSFLYVEKYGGKFYIRIEDTNPDNTYPLAYKMLEQDSEWLFKKKAEVVIQSNNMNTYYRYAEKLIKNNSAYICTCSQEEFKKYAAKKKNCPCRKLSIKENQERWKKMLDKERGGFKQGEAVLRFKSDMKHKNIAMRDFPLARINTTPHPLQKNKYKVWPLMNLAVAVDDIEQKMTHIIRAKDHRDNALRQEMIYKVLGKHKQYPKTYFLGRIHFKDMELSTTKIKNDIETGKYSGWYDPKLPTLASLKKQGYKPEAFYRFAEQIGLNEVDKTMDRKEFFLLLDDFNKKVKHL